MASDLPTGVVTLLFTDVEGSTRLLHELGDGYGEARPWSTRGRVLGRARPSSSQPSARQPLLQP